MTMKAGRSSRNADFVLIARQGDTITLGAAGAVKPKNPWADRPIKLKNPHARRRVIISYKEGL